MNTQSTYCGAGSGWSLFTHFPSFYLSYTWVPPLWAAAWTLQDLSPYGQKNQINVDKKNNST